MDRTRAGTALLFLVCIATPLVVGLIGSIFTIQAIPGWYAALSKPSFTPPSWVFGPVWTVLYILMGISLFMIVRQGLSAPIVRQGTLLFAVQLVLNLAWSVVFFGMHAPPAAFAVILMLIALVGATVVTFLKISRAAAWLLVPYLGWSCFAAVLNIMIVILN